MLLLQQEHKDFLISKNGTHTDNVLRILCSLNVNVFCELFCVICIGSISFNFHN